MTVRVVTGPAVEPLSLGQAKLHLRVDDDDTAQDDLIRALIVACRAHAEHVTRRALVEQTLELLLPCFPASNGDIILPRPPLIAVASVKYIDTGGTLTTIAAADYQVDTYAEPGRVRPAYLDWWPDVRSTDFNAVQVRYTAGYAGSPPGDGVPEEIKHWMKVRIAQLYEHREAVVVGAAPAPLPRSYVDGLLDPYRVDLFC